MSAQNWIIRGGSAAARAAGVAAVALLTVGCASGATPAPAGQPIPEATTAAADVARGTLPDGPGQVTFGWTLDEAGARVRGRGVVRHVAPDRLRLDLFGPRNESYLSAALVGDEVRLPPGASPGVAVPSPALLWAGLGVVRPPTDAVLDEATASEGATVLTYRDDNGDRYQYLVRNAQGSPLLERLERIGSRGVLESVRLERNASGAIDRARYRDWSAYRDLTLELESTKDVESFPESTWSP